MKNQQRHFQRGFGIVETMVVLVFVAILAGVGWMVWNNVINKPVQTKTTVEVKQDKAAPKPAEVTTKTYKLPSLDVAFDYPSTWTVRDNYVAGPAGPKRSLDRLRIQSPDKFTLLLDTLAYGGLGGTGPCERHISQFKLEGRPQIDEAFGIVSYYNDEDFILNISNPTLEAAQNNCLHYQEIVRVREPTTDENGYDRKAYALMFGTDILFETPVSKTKPSDKTLAEAIDILKSLRKI